MSGVSLWIWIVVAFGAAAAWGLTVVVNKRTLQYVDPFALNLVVRVPTIVLIAVVTVVLTLAGAWDLGFGVTWRSFGYITLSAVVTWLIAFNAYYLVLRLGALGVVTPIMATDPLFTAVFAVVLLRSHVGALVIIGLLVSTAGVVLISRWMEARSEPPRLAAPLEPLADAGALGPPPTVPPPTAGAQAAGKSAARLRFEVIALALSAAAGWGLGPVLIELAARSLGAVSASMMLQSQMMGLLMLVPIVWRRHRVTVRRLTSSEWRLVVRLILVASVLEMYFAIAYYVLIDEIGSVLTMLIIASSPVFAILGGVRFLGERYSWKLVVGAGVTLSGVAIATLQGV